MSGLPPDAWAVVQTWAQEHMVGRPPTQESVEFFRASVKKLLSEHFDVEPECVHIQAHVESGAADSTIMLDEVRLVDPKPRRKK